MVVDAGLGVPSHAAEAMELGADAVLVNTAIAVARDPCRMARAFAEAMHGGREAYEVGAARTDSRQRDQPDDGVRQRCGAGCSRRQSDSNPLREGRERSTRVDGL